MLEDNVREKDAVATDKKQRWLGIAYKLACVLLAALSVLVLVLMLAGPRIILWYDNVYWLDAIIKSLLPAVMVAAVVVALVNLKKETPKLLMLFGGSVGFWGAYLTAMGWTSGLLLVVAGLAVLVVMYMRLELLYREEPVAKVKSKMLVIAGVLSVLVALVQIAYAVFIAMVFGSNRTPEVSTAYFFVGLIYLAGSVGLAAACFAKNHRASVYYRMFFLGVMVVMTALMAGNVLFTLQLLACPSLAISFLSPTRQCWPYWCWCWCTPSVRANSRRLWLRLLTKLRSRLVPRRKPKIRMRKRTMILTIPSACTGKTTTNRIRRAGLTWRPLLI